MPMSTRQAKLLKLAEECAEVIQACSKSAYYGAGATYPGETMTNAEQIREELLDVLVCARILTGLGEIEPIFEMDIIEHFRRKLPKIDKYTRIAHKDGALDECWIPTLKDIL